MDKQQSPNVYHREPYSYPVIIVEKNIKKECMYVYITESLYCTAEIGIVNQLYFNHIN